MNELSCKIGNVHIWPNFSIVVSVVVTLKQISIFSDPHTYLDLENGSSQIISNSFEIYFNW